LPRPRSFEETEALDAAIDCFWRQGRDGASVRDLAAEMGINGPSLYNAFGDKQALFARALERYVDCFVRERIERLERLPSPKAAIAGFFEELIQRSISDPLQRGCLLINAAMEQPSDDPALRAQVQRYMDELKGFFRRALERAIALKEVPASLDPEDVSRLLLAVVIGLRATARLEPTEAALRGVVRPMLSLLDAPFSTPPDSQS
jgi:TetR/AcrR family transcriptional repressor of nem operon